MLKTFFIAAFALVSLGAMADEVPGIVVTKTDGSSIRLVMSSVRSIKYSDGMMIVNGKDNSQQTIAMDDVTSVIFGNVTTAIKAVAGNDDKAIVITDLGGRVVYSGNSQGGDVPASLHGVYIITVDGVSHKVAIK